MQQKDVIFFVTLSSSIPFGYVVKQIQSPVQKRLLCTVAGVVIVLLLNGLFDFLHSFITILGTYCICKSSRSCNWISFLCVFGYLLFFRLCTYVGLPRPSPYCDNVQLFITLRMIGLAFEIHEAKTSKDLRKDSSKEETSTTLYEKHLEDMSFYHFLSYGYCYCGIFTGPYFKYKTYTDMLYQTNAKDIPTVDLALKWLTYLPVFVTGYGIFSQWFPRYLEKDEFHNQSIPVQIVFLFLADIRFRCRIYIGTHMAESSCMTLCLGAYPVESCPKPGQGPSKAITGNDKNLVEEINTETVTSDKKYSFETIRGMYLKYVEFSSLKMMIRNWNVTVQWWMATYVYQQFPYRQKMVRFTAVALVSAFWHGLAPGYYLSFLFIVIAQEVQEKCARKFQPYLNEQQKVWYHWISWFVGYRLLEYFGVGVWVHSMRSTLRCWHSMYYFGHIVLVFFFIMSFLIPDVRRAERQSKKKTS